MYPVPNLTQIFSVLLFMIVISGEADKESIRERSTSTEEFLADCQTEKTQGEINIRVNITCISSVSGIISDWVVGVGLFISWGLEPVLWGPLGFLGFGLSI